MENSQIKLIFGERGEQLYQQLLMLEHRFPKIFPKPLFSNLGRFIFSCSELLLNSRSDRFLCRLLFTFHRSIKMAKELPFERIHLRILEVDSSVYGIAIALTALREDEIFDETHIIKGMQNLVPGIKSVFNTYFSHQSGRIHFCYLEIKKVRGGFFSPEEKKRLIAELPFEFQKQIERISPSLVLPGNDEDLFKNIRRLSEEIKNVHDLPQIMITFIEYSQKILKFLVIALRVVKSDTPSITSLSKQLPSLVRFSLEDIFCVDKLRKKYLKEAAVFTMDVSSSIFLRNHNEVNLRAARQYVAKALESMIGEYRDYNGGLLNKENEQLLAIKAALERKKIPFLPLLEDLFYGIKPIIMRALITAQAGLKIAVLLKKMVDHLIDNDRKYYCETLCTQDTDIVIIKTKEQEWKTSFSQRIAAYSSQIASSCIEHEGFLYLCFFQQYPQTHILLEAVQKELDQRQSLLVDDRNSILKLNLQGGDPPSLNPRLAMDIQCHILCDLLFEGMTRINRLGVPEPAAAEKIDISPDGVLYTFHLRPSCWSNGEEVTAYHFERAWKKAISDHLGFTRLDLFSPIKNAKKARQKIVSLDRVGIIAKDDKTLCVELESPCSYFLNLVATPSFFPLFGESEEPVHFNGPFILAEWKRDSWLCLSQNPFYWNVHRIRLAGIKLTMIRDPYTAYKMFQNGELDLIGDPISPLPPEILNYKEIQNKLLYKYVSRVFWIHCNTHVYPLHNTHLRRALSLGINRKRLTEKVFIDQIPHLSLLPPKYSHLRGNIEGEPEEARFYFKKALEELNIESNTFPPLVITHSDLSFEKALSTELKAQWQEILGITVQSQELPWPEFSAALDQGNFQLGGLFRRDLFSHAMSYLSFFKQSHFSLFNWDNEEFEELLARPERGEYLQKIEQLLMQETPVIPLVNQRYLVLINDRVKGLDWLENGCLDLTKVWINDENVTNSTYPVHHNAVDRVTIRRKQRTKEKINS